MMLDIGEISNKIASKIVMETDGDDEKRSIIAYGIFAMFQIAISIILVIIFGLLFDILIEALIVSFSISILRKYSGGVHATSPIRCAIIGTVICILIPKVILLFNLNSSIVIVFGIFVFALSYYLIFKLAPVDSENKPIKKAERREKLKRESIIILTVYLIIACILIINFYVFNSYKALVYCTCLYGGILWQVTSLTKVGHKIVNKIDYFLNRIYTKLGGTEDEKSK
ncbi:accessory gene regulator ArgB-like protein [Clostridium sp.]|uniref:accessory gene regulator ArgB-like protein n=1 Tax=Clostridium sp. TaxID=1506 RepID=UPI002FC7412D